MKRLLPIGFLAVVLSAHGFDIHFYKDGGAEASTITNASKIIFSSEHTIVTDNTGSDHSIANSIFSYIGFTESSGIKGIANAENIAVTVDGNTISISAPNVSSVEVFALSGNLVAKTVGTNTCDISAIAPGTYLVRANADGIISVSKIFKQF